MDVAHLVILKITKNITKHCVSGTKAVPFIRPKTSLIPTEMYPEVENRFVCRVQLTRCWTYFWAWGQAAILSPKCSVSCIITTLNTAIWTKSMKKVTPDRWAWQVKAQYTVKLNNLQRLWPCGECLLCRVLLLFEYCNYHTFLWGKPDWHKTHSTVLRTLVYNKKYQSTLCWVPGRY